MPSTPTLTSASTTFTSADIGRFVIALGIPSGTVISAVAGNTATLSPPTTLSATGLAVSLLSPKIQGVGIGSTTLTIENLTLADPWQSATVADSAPFIQNNPMPMRLNNVYFYGSGYVRSYPVTISAGDTTLNVASGSWPPFSGSDVGAAVFVTDPHQANLLPPGTYITSVSSSTSCNLSQPALCSSTGSNATATVIASMQDAVILGGTGETVSGTGNDQFNGYNTVVQNCIFEFIRRTVFLRSGCNGIVVLGNEIRGECGGGFDNEAAIDVDGYQGGGGSCFIAGNTIELTHYINGIRCNAVTSNVLSGNYIGDPSFFLGSSAYRFVDTVGGADGYNLVVGGSFSSVKDEPNLNSVIAGSSTTVSRLSTPLVCGPTGNVFYVPLQVQGKLGQGIDLQRWLDSAGTVLAKVDQLGNATFAGLTATGNVAASGTITTTAAAGASAPQGNFDLLLPYTSGSPGTTIQMATGTYTASTGTQVAIAITPTWQQSGSASNTDLLINHMESALGSGNHRFFNCQVNNIDKMYVTNAGNIITPKVAPLSGTAGLILNDGSSAFATIGITMASGTYSGASVNQNAVAITPTWNQSGSSSACDLLIKRTDSNLGSGSHYFLDCQIASAGSKFNIDNKGNVTNTGNWAGPIATPTYSTSITPDASAGVYQKITVTNSTSFTINTPGNPASGYRLTFDIINSSGTTMGTITWNAVFKLAGAFVNPGVSKRRTINFYYDGTNWVETSRAVADI